MTTTEPLAPFQWLDVCESRGDELLGAIFSMPFFRGLDPAELMRRFSRSQESDIGELDGKICAFVHKRDDEADGSHVSVFQVGEWYVTIEPRGWR
ncbi:hypothetical protein [Streptosporangium subroseum]|nr:hypothetical protein [Streptosporangium subroseum]